MWQNYALVKESFKLQKMPMNFDAMKEKSVDTLEHTFNPSIWKGKASRTLWAQGQPVIDSEFGLTMDTRWNSTSNTKQQQLERIIAHITITCKKLLNSRRCKDTGRVAGRWRGQQGHKYHVLMSETQKYK